MFEIQLCSFKKDYEGFWFSVFSVGVDGKRERCLFSIAKDEDAWYFDLCFAWIV